VKLRHISWGKALCLFLIASGCGPKGPPASHPECQRIEVLTSAATRVLVARPDSAFQYATRALQLSDSLNCPGGKADSHELIGMIFFHHGVYQEALHHLLEAGNIYGSLDLKEKIAENLNQQGLVCYPIRQSDLALKDHQRALAIYEQLHNRSGIAYSNGCIGHWYEKRQNYTEALEYQQKALQYYQEKNDRTGMATILENTGSIYEDQGNFPLALAYFTRALKLTEQTGDSLAMIVNINNIGDNYRKTRNYPLAVEWTQRAVALAAHLGDKYQLSAAYKDLSKVYSLTRDYEKAYKNLEIGRNLYQEMFEQDALRQASLFQTLFETERKNHAIQQFETDKRINTIIKAALSSFLIMVTMLGIVIISRQRLKIRQNANLIEQNRHIYETRSKLLQTEVENTHLHEQKLKDELGSKVKSLTAHTLHILSKNKILEDIQRKLSDLLQENPADHRKQVKMVLKMIDHNFIQDKDWDDFRYIFEQVHHDFFDKLQRRASDLTAADTRLAALIRLNIPSRDMAVVLGISPDSVRIARYRLRKKLKLNTGENLTHFLVSF
jgi:tetratricopeptide (TPR) repeat protein